MVYVIENYFEIIDTKDKAYLLGLLCADGCVMKYKVTLTNTDVWLLQKMKRDLKAGNRIIHKKSISLLNITRRKMVEDLTRCGCVPHKSKIIELPHLSNRKLYLAFLLGYFDGNGSQNSTRICSGSRKFLEQVKTMFNLPFTINELHTDGNITSDGIIRPIKGMAFVLCLGASLFNEMMENYSDSLPRKRHHFSTNEERVKAIRDATWAHSEQKLVIDKDILKRLVWEMPATKIAEMYGVSDRLITKRCKQLGIMKPGRGYWGRKLKMERNI